MRGQDRTYCVREITELVPQIQTRLQPALTAWEHFSGELPSSNGGGGKGGHSDRTAMLAARTDHFVRDRDLFDAALELAREALREAHRLALTATIFEKQDESIEWCRSCLRLTNHKNEPTHSPVSSDHLCRWCGDFKRQYDRWPDVRILEYRSRHGKVTEQVVKLYTKGAVA